MKPGALERRRSSTIKERSQYLLAFGVVTVMLYVIGFPVFLLFFFGMLGYFVWKVFSSEVRDDARQIFEFYLTSSEILKENDRLWYGFEVQHAVNMGESIVRSMHVPPPLVYFCLGALYQKMGNHGTAVNYLSRIVGDRALSEASMVTPTPELRAYVKTLRKIERSPAEAPQTSSAIRTLERLRRNRCLQMLDASLEHVRSTGQADESENVIELGPAVDGAGAASNGRSAGQPPFGPEDAENLANGSEPDGQRKTISEVLHDIYDQNVQ